VEDSSGKEGSSPHVGRAAVLVPDAVFVIHLLWTLSSQFLSRVFVERNVQSAKAKYL